MAKKKKQDEEVNEFEQAEAEAEANPEAEAELEASLPDDGQTKDESDVVRPTLTGEPKQKKPLAFEQPGDNNMSRQDIGEAHDEEAE